MADATSKTCMLGMPGYGALTAGAARAFWRPSANRFNMVFKYNETSLLARNFNDLWCHALNRVHKGGPLDYFAMLHSDVEPDDFWLDTLIEELEEKDLDVLGVVVPIKHPKGITSIALDGTDENQFNPLCRLTMTEIFDLPETFTAADTGRPLLLNTGCWVCRWDQEWAKKVFFTINDRISFSSKFNEYVPEVEPEDWNMSRSFNALGLKIGATRKVKLNHVGTARWTNAEAWGEEKFDAAYVPESVILRREANQLLEV